LTGAQLTLELKLELEPNRHWTSNSRSNMQTLIATLLFFGIAMAAMAVGVIFSNRQLRGSCGGTGQSCECILAKRKVCTRHKEEPAT